jgi:ABC-2 type transport system permease protein
MKEIKRHTMLSAYWANFRLGASMMVGDRADLISTIFIYLVLLTVFYAIFKVLPVNELGNPAITRGHLMWYFAITEIIVMSSQGNEREFGKLISEGQLTTLMQRPGNMMGLLLARVGGNACMHILILLMIGFCILSLCSDVALPISWTMLPLFFASTVMGVMIFILIGYITGTLEVLGPYSRPANWITNKLIFSFGGLFFPVLFFPQIMQKILAFTPFPSIIGMPGNFMLLQDHNQLLLGFVKQIFWLMAVGYAAICAERRMMRYVLIKGE